MKTYEDQTIGIAFEYPSEWVLVYNCKIRYGVDILMTHKYMRFGIMRVSDSIAKKNNNVFLSKRTLEEILKSTVQLNEAIYEDVQINKYIVRDSFTATIAVSKKDKTTAGGVMIAEKTLLEYVFNDNQMLLVVLEDTPENYEAGNSQSQLRLLFDSFRFLC